MYNTKGQVSSVKDPLGNTTTFAYDPTTGRKASETNALNNTTYFGYDVLGRLTRTWGAAYPVQYDYDGYGRRTAMHTYRTAGEDWPTDDGDVTAWVYDEPSGLLTQKTDASGKAVAYTYTPEGKLATRAWSRDTGSIVTTYGYDDNTGELLSIDYNDATPDVSFDYDRLGRQTGITDAVGTRSFAYNEHLQLESETISGLYDRVITRDYEALGVKGRPIGFALGADYAIDYDYDDVGRLDTVGYYANGVQDVAEYTYLSNSNLLSGMTTGIGQETAYTYEPKRNVKTAVQNRFGGATVSQYEYQYDNLGRRTSVLNTGAAFATSGFNLYDYNPRNELTESERYQGSNIADQSIPVNEEYRSYQYDSIGNREDATVGTTNQSYATNGLNQYTSIEVGGEVDAPVYDDDGNLKIQDRAVASGGGGPVTTQPVQGLDGQVSFEYNAENRLIAIAPETPEDGDTKLSFVYDYMGRRVEKTASTYSGGAWTETGTKHFVYDGWNLIEETDGAETKYYVWGLDLSRSVHGAGGVGGLIAAVDSDLNATYFEFDGMGNVGQVVSGADGSIVARYEYAPFGETLLSEGAEAAENHFRFSTKYYLEEVGMYDYGLRRYLPEVGRWLTRDPLGESGGANLYGFVSNGPTNAFDMLGQFGEYYGAPGSGCLMVGACSFEEWEAAQQRTNQESQQRMMTFAGFAAGVPVGFIDGIVITIQMIPEIPSIIAHLPDLGVRLEEEIHEMQTDPNYWDPIEQALIYGKDDYERGEAVGHLVGEFIGFGVVLKLLGKVCKVASAEFKTLQAELKAQRAARIAALKNAPKGANKWVWKNVRRRLGKEGWAQARQHVHHWLIPRGGTGKLTLRGFMDYQWGRFVPNIIKNQKWNLTPMESVRWHNALHGAGPDALGIGGRLWYGTPTWFKLTVPALGASAGYGIAEWWSNE